MEECTFEGFLHDLQVRGSMTAHMMMFCRICFRTGEDERRIVLAFMMVADGLYPDWRIR
jgi:hypothetical protein